MPSASQTKGDMDPWEYMRMRLERALVKDKERQERDRQNIFYKLLEDLAHLFRPSVADYKVVAEYCEVSGYLKTVTFEADDGVSPEDWLLTKQNFTEHLRRPGHKLCTVYLQPGNKIVVCTRLTSLLEDDEDEGPEKKKARSA